jgi:hypothetical protein
MSPEAKSAQKRPRDRPAADVADVVAALVIARRATVDRARSEARAVPRARPPGPPNRGYMTMSCPRMKRMTTKTRAI